MLLKMAKTVGPEPEMQAFSASLLRRFALISLIALYFFVTMASKSLCRLPAISLISFLSIAFTRLPISAFDLIFGFCLSKAEYAHFVETLKPGLMSTTLMLKDFFIHFSLLPMPSTKAAFSHMKNGTSEPIWEASSISCFSLSFRPHSLLRLSRVVAALLLPPHRPASNGMFFSMYIFAPCLTLYFFFRRR